MPTLIFCIFFTAFIVVIQVVGDHLKKRPRANKGLFNIWAATKLYNSYLISYQTFTEMLIDWDSQQIITYIEAHIGEMALEDLVTAFDEFTTSGPAHVEDFLKGLLTERHVAANQSLQSRILAHISAG